MRIDSKTFRRLRRHSAAASGLILALGCGSTDFAGGQSSSQRRDKPSTSSKTSQDGDDENGSDRERPSKPSHDGASGKPPNASASTLQSPSGADAKTTPGIASEVGSEASSSSPTGDDAKAKIILSGDTFGTPETTNAGGSGAADPTEDLDIDLTDDEIVLANPEPELDWMCGNYAFGPGLGEVLDLALGFNPGFSLGYELHLRPPSSHCTYVDIALEILDNSGHVAPVSCAGPGPCSGTRFRVDVGSKSRWTIPASSLAGLAPTAMGGPFRIRYSAPSGGSCGGGAFSSYGLAIGMNATSKAPPSPARRRGTCESTSGIVYSFDLTP